MDNMNSRNLSIFSRETNTTDLLNSIPELKKDEYYKPTNPLNQLQMNTVNVPLNSQPTKTIYMQPIESMESIEKGKTIDSGYQEQLQAQYTELQDKYINLSDLFDKINTKTTNRINQLESQMKQLVLYMKQSSATQPDEDTTQNQQQLEYERQLNELTSQLQQCKHEEQIYKTKTKQNPIFKSKWVESIKTRNALEMSIELLNEEYMMSNEMLDDDINQNDFININNIHLSPPQPSQNIDSRQSLNRRPSNNREDPQMNGDIRGNRNKRTEIRSNDQIDLLETNSRRTNINKRSVNNQDDETRSHIIDDDKRIKRISNMTRDGVTPNEMAMLRKAKSKSAKQLLNPQHEFA